MSAARRKKDANQPELPIDGPPPTLSAEAKAAAAKRGGSKRTAGGNGEQHVIAEQVENIGHRAFDPKQVQAGLHRRIERNYLEYASYVIRDRAIPNLADGLKPVQRRILWAMHLTDDGRFTKVLNVAGDTSKFHPHGEASVVD